MKDEIVSYLKALRDQIIRVWNYSKGTGGGEMSVLRGDAFEKAAVNWSGVAGDRLPLSEKPQSFFATGVSLITHMRNPKAPTVHFNIRYIETPESFWWGGGFDLTPMGFPVEEDTEYFHSVARKALQGHGSDLYEKFSQAAREYFYIPHYGRERGVGGIFFDHYNSGDFAKDFAMWKSVGDHFLESIMPIYKKRVREEYTEEDRKIQLQRRAHYVEFNLLYDRGTKFGFQSGGNPEAILCSMPPLASW
jgi:coproporphyrinogen III oxidase